MNTDYVLDWSANNNDYHLWKSDRRSNDPVSASVLNQGTWGSIRTGHVLVPLENYVLDWVPKNGGYRLWRFDPYSKDPLPGSAVQSGTWASIRTGHMLLPLGGYVLDWVPSDGSYRLWRFDPHSRDPLPGPVVQQGTWDQRRIHTLLDNTCSKLHKGHVLLPMGDEYVLDWVPHSGVHRVWKLDLDSRKTLSLAARRNKWQALQRKQARSA